MLNNSEHQLASLNSMSGRFQSYIFLHIPKTGGTTLYRIIDNQFDRSVIYFLGPSSNIAKNMSDFKKLPIELRQRIKLLKGHMLFNTRPDEYMPEPCTYITLLREPIDRVISTYYYILEHHEHYFHKHLTSNKIDLKAFVQSNHPAVNNMQTYLLSSFNPALLEKLDVKNYPWESLLESAMTNIEQHFAVTGVLEEYEEFLILLKKQFGWNISPYTRQNITLGRLPKESIPDEIISIITEANKSDIELYHYVFTRMKHSIKIADEINSN
jgi:hypothetical protein